MALIGKGLGGLFVPLDPFAASVTVGYSTVGSTSQLAGGEFLFLYGPYVASETGHISQISCRFKTFVASFNVVMGIYSDNAGSPDTKLGQTVEGSYANSVEQWVTLALQSNVNITSGVSYWIGFLATATSNSVLDSNASYGVKYMGYAYSTTLPSSFTLSGSIASKLGSVYGS